MKEKERFSSRGGFIAAAAGSAVGLYNIWKFPYEVGANGGAGFLLLYLICILLIGYPLVVAELALGRTMKLEVHSAYVKGGNKWWGLLGYATVVMGILFLSYYNVVTGWILGYALQFLKGNILKVTGYSEHFEGFIKHVPHNVLYTGLVGTSVAYIVSSGVKNGIERWSKRLMPLFLFVLIGLILYALSLENGWQGVKFYLIPDLSAITLKTLYKALSQSFVSLSVGLSILITYGAYMNDKDDLLSSAAIITLSDTGVAFLAGLMLFPFIFHQHLDPSQGMQLVFVTMPLVFQKFGPLLGPLVGVAFFSLLLLAAITSILSLLESLTKHFIDRYQISRRKAVIGVSLLIYLVGIPTILSFGGSSFFSYFIVLKKGVFQNFFGVLSTFCEDFLLPTICFLFSLFIAYQWKTKNLIAAVERNQPTRKWLITYIRFTINYICPIALGGILLKKAIDLFEFIWYVHTLPS